jgi:hypothetical protein
LADAGDLIFRISRLHLESFLVGENLISGEVIIMAMIIVFDPPSAVHRKLLALWKAKGKGSHEGSKIEKLESETRLGDR